MYKYEKVKRSRVFNRAYGAAIERLGTALERNVEGVDRKALIEQTGRMIFEEDWDYLPCELEAKEREAAADRAARERSAAKMAEEMPALHACIKPWAVATRQKLPKIDHKRLSAEHWKKV